MALANSQFLAYVITRPFSLSLYIYIYVCVCVCVCVCVLRDAFR